MNETEIVYALDDTIDVNKGPVVPLETVIRLRNLPGNSVWAIGNSRLVQEAKIQFASRDKKRVIHPDEHDRRNRLRYIRTQVPRADAYIVVDDEDLSDMSKEGWIYFKPEVFAKIVIDLES